MSHEGNADNRELVGQFLARYSSANTVTAYRRDVGQFIRFLGEKPLHQITAHDIAAFGSWLCFTEWRRPKSSGSYSPASIARKLDVVRRFVTWAVAEGHCSIGEAELQAATLADRRHRRRAMRADRHHEQPREASEAVSRRAAFREYIEGPDWRA